jgi:hypothetical protein
MCTLPTRSRRYRADPRQRASRADPCDEGVNVPSQLSDDLAGGSAIVAGRIRWVLELTRHERPGCFAKHLLRVPDGTQHAVRRGGQRYLRSVRPHDVAPLEAQSSA